MLSTQPDPFSPPPPYYTLHHTHGRGAGGWSWTSEKVRGAIVHKRGRKYQHDLLPVKTTFRVWYLYSYLVHGRMTAAGRHHPTIVRGGGGPGTWHDISREPSPHNPACGEETTMTPTTQKSKIGHETKREPSLATGGHIKQGSVINSKWVSSPERGSHLQRGGVISSQGVSSIASGSHHQQGDANTSRNDIISRGSLHHKGMSTPTGKSSPAKGAITSKGMGGGGGFSGPNDKSDTDTKPFHIPVRDSKTKWFRIGFGEYCNPPKSKSGDTILRIFLENLFRELIAAIR